MRSPPNSPGLSWPIHRILNKNRGRNPLGPNRLAPNELAITLIVYNSALDCVVHNYVQIPVEEWRSAGGAAMNYDTWLLSGSGGPIDDASVGCGFCGACPECEAALELMAFGME